MACGIVYAARCPIVQFAEDSIWCTITKKVNVLEEVMQRPWKLIKGFKFPLLVGFQGKKTTSLKVLRDTLLTFEIFFVYVIIKILRFGSRPYCCPQVEKYFLGPLEKRSIMINSSYCLGFHQIYVPEDEVDPASEKWHSFYNTEDVNIENKYNITSSKPYGTEINVLQRQFKLRK